MVSDTRTYLKIDRCTAMHTVVISTAGRNLSLDWKKRAFFTKRDFSLCFEMTALKCAGNFGVGCSRALILIRRQIVLMPFVEIPRSEVRLEQQLLKEESNDEYPRSEALRLQGRNKSALQHSPSTGNT